MQTDIELILRSDPKLLAAMRGLLRGYVTQQGLSKDRAEEVVLAVDEACTNAIRHAYRGRKTKPVALAVRSSPAWLEFEVRDEGQPASRERLERKLSEPSDPRKLKPHGLGVQLICRIFDEVSFETGLDGGNGVRMRLRRPNHKRTA